MVSMVKFPQVDDEVDARDAASKAWPIGAEIEVTWDGCEITHASTDALLGYAPDQTETVKVLAHRIRTVPWQETSQRYIVITQTGWSEYQYVEIDASVSGDEITGYGVSFRKP